ncbi:MAG: GNAT family N-acetyltransferase [Prevotellaceae bacterium]|jgi:GNAT superfamily N-acetyltransferase|nr:GNAT family N-acetyltransferase [Prevotellaceae bacterium]
MKFGEMYVRFRLSEKTEIEWSQFHCGDVDLEAFFLKDAANYERQLLGKTYCFVPKNNLSTIVCAFTLSNSSIDARNLPNSRRKKMMEHIPHEKSLSSYPATLIGRLAVSENFQGKGIGSNLLNYIKLWILEPENKTGCRFLTIDAYNNEATGRFYEANGFKYLFSSEQQEKDYIGLSAEKELRTRLMYFDLMLLDNSLLRTSLTIKSV